ncbi:MAG: phosphoglucomutase/phosphomannomutase family protein [Bacteroidetes bacterium]|nr:phosphoglucomutase/phosphomannomutase family protein [Bacteroidota bacterium]
MTKIIFGTDGWRAAIAKEFTVENVARISQGAAQWLINNKENLSVVIGHDCRFGGPLFAETAAKIFLSNNIKVYLAKGFVSTPMISMGALHHKTGLGVIITASHNPYTDNGYKLKGGYGGPLMETDIHDVEKLIPDNNMHEIDSISLDEYEKKGLLKYVDLETMYCDYLEKKFDLKMIRNSGMQFAFDAMYGSGQNVMRRLFPDITLLHCEHNPLFNYISPEPLLRNLQEMSDVIRIAEDIDCGLAIDGDADRIALFNHKGEYIDSHHILLLLIHYLNKYKKLDGKVATGFSSTQKIKKLCKLYNLDLEIVKIGFKHICGLMLTENILVGGEESGGIAVAGHIPERDGIYNGILIWEFLAKTGKSLQDIIDEIYELTGSFAFERSDLRISQEDKLRIVKNCELGAYKNFGKYKVEKIETLDGFKYYFNDDEWLMIRPSGTEPVLRTYAESYTKEDALKILKAGYDTIMQK